MSIIFAQQLLRRIEGAKSFPPPDELHLRTDLVLYSAIRESDEKQLTPKWWRQDPDLAQADFMLDPLGARIPEVWADMLFGIEPEFESPLKSDRTRLEEAIDYNDLPSELHWAEQLCSSEGEVWWRLVSVPIDGHAKLEWHSRLNVIPLWLGNRLAAAAFISILELNPDSREQWTYIEVHSEGAVLNRLYKHKNGSGLGDPLPLTDREETEELRSDWTHPLPILCGRISNKRGRNAQLGGSDFKGLTGLLNGLNESANIGQDNVRLTAKQRVVLPERFLTARGQMPKGAEVIIATEVDADPTKIKNDMAQIEWSFDASALLAWKEDQVDTILTRARIAPQLVGRHTEMAATGPALRARVMDSIMAATGKAKEWDDKVPELISLLAQLESLPTSSGGPGNKWRSTEPVTFKRNNSLPEDETDRSNRTVTEVNAKIKSRQTAIEENNPTWGPDRVSEELDRIEDEEVAALQRMAEQMNPGEPAEGGPVHNSSGDTPVTTNSSTGENNIKDPAKAGSTRRGKRKTTSVPDPQRVRT
jgi:hypothetical protein